MDDSLIFGLSKVLYPFFDLKSAQFSKEVCSIDIILNDDIFISNDVLDKGILISLADTFSSYVVKYLCPDDDFTKYLSLKINFISFHNIYKSLNKVTMSVSLVNKIERDILLDIKIINNNKILCKLSHLKRKIK